MHAHIRRPRTTPRPPQLHEREWRGRNVDRNLDDAWLEVLNALTAFDLISICEGHLVGRRTSEPHINLRIKSNRQSFVVANWDVLQASIRRLLDQAVAELCDTSVEAELRRRLRASPRRRNNDQDDFVVRLQRASNTGGPSNSMTHWFDRMIPFVQKLDQVVAEHAPS